MDKLPGHKERSLAWLQDLEEAIKTWNKPDNDDHLIGLSDIVPTRWTAESVRNHYLMETANMISFHRLSSHICGLLNEMRATPDAITQEDIGALSELVKLRNNVEVVMNAERAKRKY